MTSTRTARRQRIVMDAAFQWWRSLRPTSWTFKEHLSAPQVNCEGPEENALALAVARYAEAQRDSVSLERTQG